MTTMLVPRRFDTLRVTGPDRLTWLNGMVTQAVDKLKPAEGALALSVQKNGKIESEVVLLTGEEDVLLGVREGVGASLREKLDRHLIMENAEVSSVEPGTSWFLVLGDEETAARAARVARDSGGRAAVVSRAGQRACFAAIGPESGEAGGAFVTSLAAGGLSVATEEEWLRRRIELGIAEFGADYGVENYAQEALLEKDAVSFDKGCYLGQEAVFMLEKRGHVSKKLVRLEADGPLSRGLKLHDRETDKPVGEITSSFGPSALGFVKYKLAVDGVEVTVQAAPPLRAKVRTLG
jgi:folate-binding protein YgfZ